MPWHGVVVRPQHADSTTAAQRPSVSRPGEHHHKRCDSAAVVGNPSARRSTGCGLQAQMGGLRPYWAVLMAMVSLHMYGGRRGVCTDAEQSRDRVERAETEGERQRDSQDGNTRVANKWSQTTGRETTCFSVFCAQWSVDLLR